MDFKTSQHQFTAHLRNPTSSSCPNDIEPRRMAIYESLIYNNIEGFIANAFPVIRQLYSDDNWHDMIRDFIIQHQSETPLFHEIAREFLAYLNTERDNDNDPPFLAELAHYEWVELALSILDVECDKADVKDELILDTLLMTAPAAWSFAYQYPVHQISEDFQPVSTNHIPVFLLIYRNAHDNVTFLELNPVSARLIDLLNQGETGRQAAKVITQELKHNSTDIVLNGATVLISDWLQRGILIEQ